MFGCRRLSDAERSEDRPGFNPSSSAYNTLTQQRNLRRMKAVPLLLLFLMAAVFIGTLSLGHDSGWAGYVGAFSEAAMIGALADWFAVVAIFRHPMGIPIPHTAIIPRRKQQLGQSLARFVRHNFLTEAVIRRRLQQTDLAAAIARFSASHEQQITQTLVRLMRWMLGAIGEPEYRDFMRRNLFSQAAGLSLAPTVGKFLEILAQNRHHQAIFTEGLRLGIVFLEDNRDKIRDHINQGSPWWLPGFVDNKIYNEMVERIQTQLLAMVLDPEHELREQFDQAFGRFADDLGHSPGYASMMEQLKQDLIKHPVLHQYLDEVIEKGAAAAARALDEGNEEVEQFISQTVQRMAGDVLHNEPLRATFNTWLGQALEFLVGHYGDHLTLLITETMEAWDGAEAARLIELQVGKDLQFIRINGTLVGGLAGLLIYSLVRLLG